MKILLLEDDVILNELISEYLEEKGFEVIVAFDGYEALDLIKEHSIDILLLDVGVPKLSGFELLEYLKDIGINTPTIYITSLSSAKDLEKAFHIGCDDYIKKPFELKELEVRIQYLIKTHKLNLEEFQFQNGALYNFESKSITIDGNNYTLSQKEAQILEYFIQNSNRVISLDELVANIWEFDTAPTYATIRTYIKNLRKILGKDLLTTLKGVGYKFTV